LTDTNAEKTQADLSDIRERLSKLESDTGTVLFVQDRLLDILNELQNSLLKVKEAIIKLRQRVG
jgi:hypothetical protein